MKKNNFIYNTLDFRFGDLSKKYQLILTVSMLLIMVSIGFSMLLPKYVHNLLINEFEVSHRAMALVFAENLITPLSTTSPNSRNNDYFAMATSAMNSLPQFTHLFVYNSSRAKVFEKINPAEQAQTQLFRPIPNKKEYIDRNVGLYVINQDVTDGKSTYGYITVVFSIKELTKSISRFRIQIIITCALILIASIWLTIFISNLISKPLEILLATFVAITRGDLTVRVNMDSKEEFGQLAKTFNRMVDSLEESYFELAETNKNMELIVEQRTKQLRSQIDVREKAEDKLRLINKTMSSIINASPLPIVTISTDFRIKSASPAFKQIFNYEEYEILEKVVPFVYMTDTDFFTYSLQKIDEPNKTERIILKGRKKNGDLIDLNVAAVAEFNDENRIAGYVIIIDDITEKLLFEKALLENEAKYRSLIEDSIVGIGIIGDDNFTLVNQALLDIWEYSNKTEFINTPFLDMVTVEDKHKIINLFRLRDENTGTALAIPITEIKILCRSGKEKFVQISSNFLLLGKDRFLQMTFVDITDRKNAERQMLQINEELEKRVADRTSKLNKTLIDLRIEMSQRAKISKELQFKSKILERTTSVCLVFNSKGQCIYLSPYSLEVFEWNSDDLMGMGIWKNTGISVSGGNTFSIDDVVDILSGKQEMYANDFTIQITTPNGNNKFLQLSNSLGQSNTLITAGAEITEQILAQQELKVMSDKLASSLDAEKELNSLKTRFISMVSHEFRNPLAIILNCSSIIEQAIENKRTDIAAQYIDKINKSVKTMNTLMEDILVIGRSQYKKIEEFYEVNFVEFVETSITDIQSAYSFSSKAELIVKNECKPFYSNEDALKHIVYNLITNALKYTINGEDVHIIIDRNEDDLEFTVSDRGIGIPEKDLKMLFSNFFRASNVGKISGTGLGLNIVKQSVNNLYGTISVESIVDKGTTFKVILPMDIRSKIEDNNSQE